MKDSRFGPATGYDPAMKAEKSGDSPPGWKVRPLGAEASRLAEGLRSSPYLDASFLGALVDRDLVQTLNGREAWTGWWEGQALGFLILDPGPDAVTELTLAVLPEARRKGIGHRLVEFALERGRSEGWSQITLMVGRDNPVAQQFFEAQGFREIHTELEDYRCMRRSLAP